MAKRIFYIALTAFSLATFGFFCYRIAVAVLYPVKFSEEISVFASKNGLDETLVYSIINTESRFRADCVSQAGAVGLMQLMPSTAEWLAEKIGVEYSYTRLYEPAFNIELGTYYLSYLLSRFPDEATALAAYNAGEGTVRGWLKNPRFSNGGALTGIPFPETEDYIRRIEKNKAVYAKNSARKIS